MPVMHFGSRPTRIEVCPLPRVLVQKVGQCSVIRFRDRFEEVLLQPSLVYPCGSDIRKVLYTNVVLPGGTATFQGIG